MLPFFLLVGVFLLLAFYFTRSSSSAPTLCAEKSDPYEIGKGDTCWGIAKSRGVSRDELQTKNPGMDCSLLQIGTDICIPQNRD